MLCCGCIVENRRESSQTKEQIIRTLARAAIVTTRNERVSINHMALKQPKKIEEFKEGIGRAMDKLIEDDAVQSRLSLSQQITKKAAKIAGTMQKRKHSSLTVMKQRYKKSWENNPNK